MLEAISAQFTSVFCCCFAPAHKSSAQAIDLSYFEQIGVLQTSLSLNCSAWNNKVGLWFVLLVLELEVMINKDIGGHLYLLERGEILRPSKDSQVRKHLPMVCLLIKDESWGIEDD